MNEPTQQLTRAERIADRVDKEVTGSLAISGAGAMSFTNVTEIMEFAKLMALAGVAVPKHLRENPGACLALVLQASEWRMSPFSVANKSYSVNDRLAYEAQLVNAVILQRAPIVGRFKIDYSGEGGKRKCTVAVKVKDGDAIEMVEYTSPEFDRIPVKNSPLWKGDPDQQLFYYSSRAMCRRHFPDVLLGVYTPEEMAYEVREVGPSANAVTAPKIGHRPALFGGQPIKEEATTETQVQTQDEGPSFTEDAPPTETEDVVQDNRPPMDILASRMDEAGIEESELMEFFVKTKQATKGQSFGDLKESKYADALKNWAVILATLRPSK